ncbi:MAG: hypothetical protein P8181_03495, partial [bacterium]
KSGGRDVLYIVDTNKGRIRKKSNVKCDGMTSPAWSPDGKRICVSANFGGQTDLILVDAETGDFERLTYDAADQLSPRFFPDGKRIAFTYYPELTIPVPKAMNASARETLSEMDFLAYNNVREGVTLDIFELEISTGVVRPLVQTAGNDDSPVIFDGGRKMIYTSDVSGINNLYIADLEKGSHYRITDALSGLFTPDVVESKNRLTFTAFIDGGFDIFISDDLDRLIEQRYADAPEVAGLNPSGENDAGETTRHIPVASADIPLAAVLGRARHEKPDLEKAEDTPEERGDSGEEVFSVTEADSASIYDVTAVIPDKDTLEKGKTQDRSLASRASMELDASGHPKKGPPKPGMGPPGSESEPATKGATVSKYKFKMAPDFVGSGGV